MLLNNREELSFSQNILNAYGLWQSGLAEQEAVFSFSFPKMPYKGSYAIFAGLDKVVDIIQNFAVSAEQINSLRQMKNGNSADFFSSAFLSYLSQLKSDVEILSLQEGSVVFPSVPMLRMRGSLVICQLLANQIANTIHFESLVATRAARLSTVAKSSLIFEGSANFAANAEMALRISRAAWIGGVSATTNLQAANFFGIPLQIFSDENWLISYNDELSAYRNFAKLSPQNGVFLLDGKNISRSIENCLIVAKELQDVGGKLYAVQIHSGQFLELSKTIRKQLNEAGLKESKIFAGNDFDEFAIEELKAKGARIDGYTISTKFINTSENINTQLSFSLSAIRQNNDSVWQHKVIDSEELVKVTNPGLQLVKRFKQDNHFSHDVIYDEVLGFSDLAVNAKTEFTEYPEGESEDILQPIIANGKVLKELPSLAETRVFCQKQLSSLSQRVKATIFPDTYKVCLDDQLYQIKKSLLTLPK